MGLIISKFVNSGVEFVNAYAKIGDVIFDNSSKIATFSVEFYNNSEKRNLIKKITGLYVVVNPGSDMIAQCYNRLNQFVTNQKSAIEMLTSDIDAEIDLNKKYRLAQHLRSMEKSELLCLDGATNDENVQI